MIVAYVRSGLSIVVLPKRDNVAVSDVVYISDLVLEYMEVLTVAKAHRVVWTQPVPDRSGRVSPCLCDFAGRGLPLW